MLANSSTPASGFGVKTIRPSFMVDPEVMAGLAYGMLQGAFILSRVEGNPRLMSEHLRQFRRYLEVVFGVEQTGARARRAGA